MINNIADIGDFTMAREKIDPIWQDIFDSLIIESNPPTKYIRAVQVMTKDGDRYDITPEEFTELVESEKKIAPENSLIISCKLRIDFTKIKRDVDRWSNKLLDQYDTMNPVPQGKPKRTRKPKDNA